MEDFGFDVKEHIVPCQHIRGYPHATKTRNAALRLAVKEYTPKAHVAAAVSPDAVTIIGLHANGIPKETYEPLWEQLGVRLGNNLRAIWIADVAHQGASGILNEHLLGDDPNWFDHSRDLLFMLNHFRERIQQPLIGIAHSMGCAQLVQLSLMHPALFQGLILMEPVVQDYAPPGPNAAFMTSYRPDLWASEQEAKDAFRKNKWYKSWDERALDAYLKYGLRKTPTTLYPQAPPGSVTLATTKHQEAWSYVRSTFAAMPPDGEVDEKEALLTADLASPEQAAVIFNRAEPALAFHMLPYVQPPVLWMFGQKSYINGHPKAQQAKVLRTGTTRRGNGGPKMGAVQAVVVDAGHLHPLEKIEETAEAITPFIERQMRAYRRQEEFWDGFDSEKSDRDGLVVSGRWLREVKKRSDANREVREKSKL